MTNDVDASGDEQTAAERMRRFWTLGRTASDRRTGPDEVARLEAARAALTAEWSPGQTVFRGRFRIVRQLGVGVGSFGTVFHAEDLDPSGGGRRDVALKVVNCDAADALREALSTTLAASDHVIRILESPLLLDDRDPPLHVLVYQLADESLADHVARDVLWSRKIDDRDRLRSAADIVLQAARGLAAIHQRGILHLDLKPANILRDAEVWRISDFGIARGWNDVDADQLGTWQFMAPEQFVRKPVHETDLWALGCVFYWLLTGHHAFDGSEDEILTKVQYGSYYIRRLNPIPTELADICTGLLVRDPGQRSLKRTITALEKWLRGQTKATADNQIGMYLGCVSFNISKSYGNLQLVPEAGGLRFVYSPFNKDGVPVFAPGFLNLVMPLEGVGGMLVTARAFIYGVEGLDENVILQGGDHDILIKLYRDKPRGENGRLDGTETCWLRLVTGKAEEERRRIKLGPRDLLCLEMACQLTANLAIQAGMHAPLQVAEVLRHVNPNVAAQLDPGDGRDVPAEAADGVARAVQ